MEHTIPEIYLGTFELAEHEKCPLLEYSKKTELTIDIQKHFPAYQRELCGIIFNIPALRTQKEVELLAGENLRITGVQTYDGSTLAVGTMKDEITNYILYSSNFATVYRQSFQKEGKEIIGVATIFQKQLDTMLDGLSKLVGEANVIYAGAEKRHLTDFIEKPLMKSSIVTPEEHAIVTRAIEMGYFDIPRRIDLTDLATTLDLSKSALSPKMREIYKKVIMAYLHRVTKL